MSPVSIKHIALSLALAFFLYLMPWAGFGLLIRPDFVFLTLLYWLLRAPHLCNIGLAWSMGLLIDLTTGSLFGQNALAYVVTAFIALSYLRRLTLFSHWQQTLYVLGLLLLNQVILLVLKLFNGYPLPSWSYFLPSLCGILLWHFVDIDQRRRR